MLQTSLITDGAPAYPKGARECQIDHDYASHSKGQFAKWIKKRTTKNQHQHRHDRSVLGRTKKHTKWIEHTKSVALSVRTLLAAALHQYVQRHVEHYSKSCTASVAWLNRPNFNWQA